MKLDFEWNSAKERLNQHYHDVSFAEASTVFGDPQAATAYDAAHSTANEDRYITMGLSSDNRLLIVVHCDRGEKIRIITARQATSRESDQYEKGKWAGRDET